MPDRPGVTVVTNLRVYYFYTQGCGRDRRSGIPCALHEGQGFFITRAFGVAGMRNCAFRRQQACGEMQKKFREKTVPHHKSPLPSRRQFLKTAGLAAGGAAAPALGAPRGLAGGDAWRGSTNKSRV